MFRDSSDQSHISSGHDTHQNLSSFSQCLLEFKYPISKESLCDDPINIDPSRFFVRVRNFVKNWSDEKTLTEIERIGNNLCGGGGSNSLKWVNILDNDNFDVIYSILFYLETTQPSQRKELIENLNKAIKQMLKSMEKSMILLEMEQAANLGDEMERSNGNKSCNEHIYRNCLKAYIYVLTWFLSDNSRLKDTISHGQKNQAKKNQKAQNSTSQSKKANTEEKIQAINNEIQLHLIQSLQLIREILDKEIKFLWPDLKVEDDLAKVIMKTCFDLLENANNTKISEIKDGLFQILQTIIQKYSNEIKYMQSQISQKIIDLLYSQDQIAPHLAELVGLIAKTQGPQLPCEIIRELTKQIFNNDSSHETLGIKNVGIFLKKLAKKQTKVVYQSIGCLIGFFDCESYLLRQAIIKILACIIQFVLTPPSDQRQQLDQQTILKYDATKDKFLDLLLKRFMDKSSFCRAKVIKSFKKLTEANVVPRFKYFELLKQVIGRLKDQTSNVRKNALKLFGQIIVIYGMIFNVDLNKGEKFLQLAEIQKEKSQIINDGKDVQDKYEAIKKEEQRIKLKIIEQLNIQDEASAQIALSQNQEYMKVNKKFRDSFELLQQTEYIYKSLGEYEEFIKLVDDAIGFLTLLLSSKNSQDAVETIKVFRLLFQFGIKNSMSGIKKMLTLIFSKEPNIQQAIFECYRVIYFDQSLDISSRVKNLISMVSTVNLTELTCFEELLKKFVGQGLFEREIFNTLWRLYTHPSKASVNQKSSIMSADQLHLMRVQSKEEQRASILLLRIMGSQNIDVLMTQKDNLYEYSLKFAQFEKPDFIILKEALMIYEKIVIFQMTESINLKESSRKKSKGRNEAQVKQLEERDKEYLFKLFGAIVKTFGTDDPEWFCATEQLLNTLFNIKARNSPDYAKWIVQALTTKLYTKDKNHMENTIVDLEEEFKQSQAEEDAASVIQTSCESLRNDVTDIHYSQLFFVVGHISIKMLTFIEQIESELKKCSANPYGSYSDRENASRLEDERNENELEQIAGGQEGEIEQFSLMLQKITEDSLIQSGMLGKFLPPIVKIANIALSKYQNLESKVAPQLCLLERSAILSLCKYMCVSSKICTEHIDILFQLLNSKIDFGVKSNIIISIGDLYNRFPNILNEKTKDIFALLQDQDNLVRRQALMVITHLILNDMLKLKGEIVDICMLLEDPDDKIRDQVQLFLHELHTKANHIIYNLFAKAISRLSRDFKDLSREKFENIAKSLLSHIDKERQTEQIVDKLCQKLQSSPDPIEWRNSAYCLSQIRYNEKIFQKLIDKYETFQQKITSCKEIKDYFQNIIIQAKKFPKPEMKKKVDDFENTINFKNQNPESSSSGTQSLNSTQSGKKTKKQQRTGSKDIHSEERPVDNQSQQQKLDIFKANSKKRMRPGATNNGAENDPKQQQITFPVDQNRQLVKAKRSENLMQQQIQVQQIKPSVDGKLSTQQGNLSFAKQEISKTQAEKLSSQRSNSNISQHNQPNQFNPIQTIGQTGSQLAHQQNLAIQNAALISQMQLQLQQNIPQQQYYQNQAANQQQQQQQLQQQQAFLQQQQMLAAYAMQQQMQNLTPQQLMYFQNMQMEQQLELEDDGEDDDYGEE